MAPGAFDIPVQAVDANGIAGTEDYHLNMCDMALTVTNANDSGPGSLRQAIVDVCEGGVITFDNDYTIPLASQLTIDKGLAIDGAGRTVTVSGEHAARVFQIEAGLTVALQNLTVANGLAGSDGHDGAGVWVSGANGQVTRVNIQHATFRDNVSTHTGGLGGGGVSSYNGILLLTDVAFVNNTAVAGGGLSNTYGSTTLENVTFAGNHATW